MTGFDERSDAERYRDIVEGVMFAADLAWWEMDVRTKEVAFNEHKAAMFGRDPEAFDVAQDFVDRLHPDDVEATVESMANLVAGDAERYDIEYRAMHPDGSHTWCHDVGGVVERDESGDPTVVAGVVEDVTDYKEYERDLRERNEQLAVLNRIVRHDLRNDLLVITGWLEELRSEVPAEHRERVRDLVSVGHRGIELTEAARDATRLVRGEGGVECYPVSLDETLRTELSRVRAAYPHATFEAGEIPAVDVLADPLLPSVFRNLLNNAVQHHDRPDPHVAVGVEVDPDTVTVTVADDGPGIPEDRLERLAGDDDIDVDVSGHGLGLYLVGRLVRGFGGDVAVRENDPRGTVFDVTLRRATDPNAFTGLLDE